MATRGSRSEKVKRIFQQFDANRDGGLNRDEMAALVVAVNPRVKFSDEQINAILDEVFRTYGEFIDGEKGLTYEGLLRTYDDGAGDVDRDFDALELELNLDENTKGISEASSSSIADERLIESRKKQRTAAWAVSPNHGIVFDDTWNIVDDLEILIKRLKAKQAKDGKLKGDNFDAYSDAGWSRELGPSTEISDKRVSWEEYGHDYAAFVKELGVLRSRADGARSREEAFDGHMAIGRVLYEHQLFKEALVSFKRACELEPVDVKPHFRTGNCYYVLGKYKEAKEEFLLALEAAESGGNQWGYLLPQIYVNLGIALEGEGMVLSACEYYREAAILCPTHFRALKLLGSALFGVGEYRAAVKALEEAIFMKPDYADAHCDLASALHAMGEDERAIEVFQKAIDLKPGHVDALYNLGGLYMDLGRFQRASEMYTRVLAVWPNHWRAQLNKAVSLLGAGETEDAKKALKEALKMTNRVELHDAISHLKQLQKKKVKSNGGANGEGAFITVEPSKFKTVGEKTTLRPDLASALQIRAFQRITRLGRCDVDLVKKEMVDGDVPVSYSGAGVPEKSIRKPNLEQIIRRLLNFLKPETFQGAVKAINERILSVLDESGSGRVDLGVFFAVLAPICTADSLEFTHLTQSLTHSSIVALDAEWKPTSTHQSHFPTVTLLQLACQPGPRLVSELDESAESDGSVTFLLDLVSIPLTSIWEVLRDVFVSPDILKLGFRFKQDLVYLSSTFRAQGCDPGFDRVEPFLDIASVYNHLQHKQHGRKISNQIKSLATICEEVLGFSLAKELQCSDWSHRPLTEEQKTYAAMDAHCLLKIFNVFHEKIVDEGSNAHNTNQLAPPNVNLGLKEVLEKHDVCCKIVTTKFCEALDIVQATASDFPQRIATVQGMVSRSSQRKTVPMDESLLKVVKRYGGNILLKELDKKPKGSRKRVKKQTSVGVNCNVKRLGNSDDWQGPPPWDLSLGGDGNPKFLCDVMVEGLAKHLRCVGIDAAIPNTKKPESRELIEQALKEKRVLLTRDAKLLRHEYLISNQICMVKSLLKNEQLLEVIESFELKISEDQLMSRCTKCNGRFIQKPLTTEEAVEAAKGFQRIPSCLFNKNLEFWQCMDCRQLYWEGTQYHNAVQKFIDVCKLND